MGCILSLIFEVLKFMAKMILSQAILFVAFFILLCYAEFSLLGNLAWWGWSIAVLVNLFLSIKIGWPIAGKITEFIFDIW